MNGELSRVMFRMPDPQLIWVLLAIVLIIVGPKYVPRIAAKMGETLNRF
ncbi:twin-arginine translocase TatA/TatE family subunit [Candidatus Sumerlaeota bacterium]|nr:twin-arginine translocase TatA/TatE family subunit [Candidatus Sumerlaeota bacterium]